MVCVRSPLLSVQVLICPTRLRTAVTMVRDFVMRNRVRAGVAQDDIAVVGIEDIAAIVTEDI